MNALKWLPGMLVFLLLPLTVTANTILLHEDIPTVNSSSGLLASGIAAAEPSAKILKTSICVPPADALNVRVEDSDSFMFEFGPTGRFVADFKRGGPKAETSLPGGESAVPGDPDYVNLLEPCLRNETFRLHLTPHAAGRNARSVEKFLPGTS